MKKVANKNVGKIQNVVSEKIKEAMKQFEGTIKQLQEKAENNFSTREEIITAYKNLNEHERKIVIEESLNFLAREWEFLLYKAKNKDAALSFFFNLHNPEIIEGLLLAVVPEYRPTFRAVFDHLYCCLFPPSRFPYTQKLYENVRRFMGEEEKEEVKEKKKENAGA